MTKGCVVMDHRSCFVTRMNEMRKKKRLSKIDFSLKINEELNGLLPFQRPPSDDDVVFTFESLVVASKLLGVTTDYLLGLSDSPR